MSLPRFIVPFELPPAEHLLVPLDEAQARHLGSLRLAPGAALELLLPGGVWRADLVELNKRNAAARLVAPVEEVREAPIPLHACLPITAQLNLWDEWLPGVVELGASLIQPIVYRRSEYDARRTSSKLERWHRIILGACEQSHRSRIPELREPLPFEALLTWNAAQKWVAYELATGERNPSLRLESLAFTHGPEGGIADEEFAALRKAGWQSLTLGRSILRAATCPAAILGAVQVGLGRQSGS
jgi:16S rRNA (uracil1498-N3)-methyltransferase